MKGWEKIFIPYLEYTLQRVSTGRVVAVEGSEAGKTREKCDSHEQKAPRAQSQVLFSCIDVQTKRQLQVGRELHIGWAPFDWCSAQTRCTTSGRPACAPKVPTSPAPLHTPLYFDPIFRLSLAVTVKKYL